MRCLAQPAACNPAVDTEIQYNLVAEEALELQEALRAFGLEHQPQDPMEFIDQIEEHMVGASDQVTLDTEHHFTPGLYMRTCFIPAGVISTTKIHNTTHPLALMRGSASIWTKEAGVVTYHAPCILITTPGTRRIFYAHSDTTAVTFHPTEETDLGRIEAEIITPHFNKLLA